MKSIAVIDLGTNTFHLLIAQLNDDDSFQILFKERQFTKLGEEGTKKIGENAYRRGIQSLEYFNSVISEYSVDQIVAIGTAALREASNSGSFIEEAKKKTGIAIKVIDGQQEASYIHAGVRSAIPQVDQTMIIMDIGGGSVEFIISESGEIRYLKSFKIGLVPLHAVADISDIASPDDVVHIHKFLVGQLSSLYAAIQRYRPQILVGSAGAFEVLVTMNGSSLSDATYSSINTQLLEELYVKVLGSSKNEKLKMPGLPAERVDYIAAAMVLIWHIFDSVQPDQILVSKYALKEGILSSYLD